MSFKSPFNYHLSLLTPPLKLISLYETVSEIKVVIPYSTTYWLLMT